MTILDVFAPVYILLAILATAVICMPETKYTILAVKLIIAISFAFLITLVLVY